MGNSIVRTNVARSTSSIEGTYRPIRSDSQRKSNTNDCISLESPSLCSIRRLLGSSHENSEHSAANTETWPISQVQSIFLPEFPITYHTKDILPENHKVIEDLAVGAFGKVFKVDETHAVKVISKSKILEENLVQQVKQELQILKAIAHHPFVVKFLNCWQSRNKLYIITEFISNGELLDLLNVFTFPLQVVKIYIAQLALVLDFLHNAGIIYRDLKAENILLDASFDVRLIDFGLSKWLSYGSSTNTICGTPNYIAPEVVGGSSYGHACDWWSLGVLSCRMMTGQFPEVHNLFTETTDKTTSSPPSSNNPPPTVKLPMTPLPDASCEDLLTRLLEPDPTKRLKSLRTIKTLRFFHKFPMDDVSNKSQTAKQVWHECMPQEKLFCEFHE